MRDHLQQRRRQQHGEQHDKDAIDPAAHGFRT
jgi:hypothetical protein